MENMLYLIFDCTFGLWWYLNDNKSIIMDLPLSVPFGNVDGKGQQSGLDLNVPTASSGTLLGSPRLRHSLVAELDSLAVASNHGNSNLSFRRRTVERSANTSSKVRKCDLIVVVCCVVVVTCISQVIKLMQSFKSRIYLNLPSEIVPATLKKQAKPTERPFGGPPGDRPRGPPVFDGERRFGGDRDGYRRCPRGPSDDFEDMGGAPAEYNPSFRGPGGRPGFGRGAGGYGAPTSSNIP
ncbi:hypothetical protein VNO78_07710 [Psophocarpus tetragonolobus]|uniref:Uncharacterized protein n=1 Tax=Psophocarpus tetragonolobus TaxID=3891 RepID=A0AAN9STQ5_PSOTE